MFSAFMVLHTIQMKKNDYLCTSYYIIKETDFKNYRYRFSKLFKIETDNNLYECKNRKWYFNDSRFRW